MALLPGYFYLDTLIVENKIFKINYMPKAKKRTYLFNIYRKVAIGFVALTVILIGTIVFFSLIQANIEVQPRKILQSVEFLVGVGKGASGETIDGRLEERLIEGEEQVEATATKVLEEKAFGKLTIINTTDSPQVLVATTRFLTPDGILFRLKNQTTVPAKGRVEAEVYADKAGASGNIGPSRFTIPGLNPAKQKLIWAESQQAMSGGTRSVRVVSPEDIARGEKLVLKKLEEEALQKYKDEVKEEFSDVVSKILSSEVIALAKAGEEKQNFIVRAKVKLALVPFSRSKLEEVAKVRLLLALPPDKELLSFDGEAVDVKLDNFDLKGDKATLRVYADGDAVLKKTSPVLNVEKIAGMRIEDAKKYLESFDSIESVKITSFPSWLKNIPTLKDHIVILIKK